MSFLEHIFLLCFITDILTLVKSIPFMYFSAVLLCIATSNIIGVQFLLPTGRQKEYTLSIFAGCVLNLSLNLLLIPRYLSVGAAIGSVIAELGVTLVQLYYTKSEFSIKQKLSQKQVNLLSICKTHRE